MISGNVLTIHLNDNASKLTSYTPLLTSYSLNLDPTILSSSSRLCAANNYNPNAYIVWGSGLHPAVRQALWLEGRLVVDHRSLLTFLLHRPTHSGAEPHNSRSSTMPLTIFQRATPMLIWPHVLPFLSGNVIDLAPDTLLTALLAVNVSTVVGCAAVRALAI